MRKKRQKSATCVYHIMVKGIEDVKVFEEDRDKSRMRKIIAEHASDYNTRIYAYSILDNHIHILIKSDIQELSSYMAKVLAAYAKYYNYKKDKKGKVFQDRFYSEAIEIEIEFWNCMRYIHGHTICSNGVRNKVKNKFSSLSEYYCKEQYILDCSLKEYIQSRFSSIKEFIQYNQKEIEVLVWDVKEDLKSQRVILMKQIIQKIAKEEKVGYEEILEYYPYVERSICEGHRKLRATYNELRIIVNELKKVEK